MFANAEKYKDVEILARYDDKTDIVDLEKAAVVYRKVGKGGVILSGTHPEFAPHLLHHEMKMGQVIL